MVQRNVPTCISHIWLFFEKVCQKVILVSFSGGSVDNKSLSWQISIVKV